MKLCIIGAGASGILLSLLLHQFGIDPKDICLIDPFFDAGALQRNWSPVISNTTWRATVDAVKKCLPSFALPDWASELPPDQPTPLLTIAKLLQGLFSNVKFQTVRGQVQHAIWKPENAQWTLLVQSGVGITELNCTKLIFTQGSIPKQYDIPIPSIPLEVALDQNRLLAYVGPKDRVIVFGTNHSGVVALKNLVSCGGERIVGVYKNEQPFIWARDGEYDGLKLDGAAIADSIVAGAYPTVSLVAYNNIPAMMRETRHATWLIYAAGFMPNTAIRVTVDSVDQSYTDYDPTTGVLKNVPNAWGFGIAYPSQAPDGIHFDVGISPFLEHFYKQIPSITVNL